MVILKECCLLSNDELGRDIGNLLHKPHRSRMTQNKMLFSLIFFKCQSLFIMGTRFLFYDKSWVFSTMNGNG